MKQHLRSHLVKSRTLQSPVKEICQGEWLTYARFSAVQVNGENASMRNFVPASLGEQRHIWSAFVQIYEEFSLAFVSVYTAIGQPLYVKAALRRRLCVSKLVQNLRNLANHWLHRSSITFCWSPSDNHQVYHRVYAQPKSDRDNRMQHVIIEVDRHSPWVYGMSAAHAASVVERESTNTCYTAHQHNIGHSVPWVIKNI